MNKQALTVLTVVGGVAVFMWLRGVLKGTPSDVSAVSKTRGVNPVGSQALGAGVAGDPLLSVLLAQGYAPLGARPASLNTTGAGDVLQPFGAPIIARAAYISPIRVDYTPSSRSEFYS